jgi:thymidylate kinase
MLIEFIGIDGCGKSTQALLLKSNLEKNGIRDSCIEHVFGDNILRKQFDQLLKQANNTFDNFIEIGVAILMYSGLKHMKKVFERLNKGEVVILEKSLVDLIVFSKVYGLDNTTLMELYNQLPKPNVSLCLDISATLAYDRIVARAKNQNKAIGYKDNLPMLQYGRELFLEHCNIRGVPIIDASKEKIEISKIVFDMTMLGLRGAYELLQT